MKGPTNKPKFDIGIGWSELFMFLAGLTVFIGLGMESRSEWRNAWKEKRWPTNNVTGSALVALGVFAEACLGIAGARSSRRKEIESGERIIELNAETERLRKDNNDTLILRSYRSVGNLSAFEDAMRPFAGTKYRIEMLTDSNEVAQLQWELNNVLPKAGWISLGPPDRRYQLGDWVNVYTVSTEGKPFNSAAAIALADWLDSHHTATLIGVLGQRDDAPGTVIIQIGARSETIERYDHTRAEYSRLRSRPVTPPQA